MVLELLLGQDHDHIQVLEILELHCHQHHLVKVLSQDLLPLQSKLLLDLNHALYLLLE